MERLGSKIVELHNISKAFDEKIVLNKFDYVFKRGERIGLIGKNGTGKTTFLNLITQKLAPDSGKIVLGETLKFGHYTQEGIKIKEGQKIIEVIKEFGEFIPLAKGRKITAGQLLERFLFDRKKQYDFVEKLSGGELKRLYLCTVLIQNPNFIILDEPTNDLDIITLNVLENFLLDFPGNLIVVSHDRYFMDKVVDHIFVLDSNGNISDFPGNYTDYRTYEDSKPKETVIKDKPTKIKNTVSKGLNFNEKREFGQLETAISKLANEKKIIEKAFENNDIATEKITEVSQNLEEIILTLEEKEERWLALSMKLEG